MSKRALFVYNNPSELEDFLRRSGAWEVDDLGIGQHKQNDKTKNWDFLCIWDHTAEWGGEYQGDYKTIKWSPENWNGDTVNLIANYYKKRSEH